MSFPENKYPSFWRTGLWIVGLIGVCQCAVAQNADAQSQVDMSVRRQSGGWQPTVKAREVQTAYYQAQGNLSGGMPVLPTAGQGVPGGNEHWNGGQLPAFPGGGDMPRPVSPPITVSPSATVSPPTAVSPPTSGPDSMSDNMAPPQLPMANRYQEPPYPARDSGTADNRYNDQPSYGSQASQGSPLQGFPSQGFQSQGFQSQGNNPAGPQPRGSSGVPARLASTELRTIQNGGESQPGGRDPNGSGLRETGAQPGGAGWPQDGRPAAESFTSGLPYVTPAPRGRYATSPYQPAVFQSSDHRPQLVPAQFASTSSVIPPANAAAQGLRQAAPPANLIATQATMPNYVGAAPPAYLTAQQAALPQYRYPQPGIYPTAYQCAQPAPSFPSTGAVPGGYIPPTLPPNLTPNLYTPNNAGYRPLFSLGQENYNVQLGRGIIGQPTAYVPGQHIRNFLRYLSP